MSNLRDLRIRIRSVKSTQKITAAMKMVATSNLKRSQDKLFRAKPYVGGLDQTLQTALQNTTQNERPLLLAGNPKNEKTLLLFITGDRGLCANYNSLVLQTTRRLLKEMPSSLLVPIGKKGRDFFLKREKIQEAFLIDYAESYFDATDIATYIEQLLEQNVVGQVKIVYTNFKTTLSSEVTVQDLVPFHAPFCALPDRDIKRALFGVEPKMESLLKTLSFQALTAHIFYCLLTSKASEESARMVAMDNATRNAKDMINHLQLVYNRTRQAHITRELIEIIAGAEAV